MIRPLERTLQALSVLPGCPDCTRGGHTTREAEAGLTAMLGSRAAQVWLPAPGGCLGSAPPPTFPSPGVPSSGAWSLELIIVFFVGG